MLNQTNRVGIDSNQFETLEHTVTPDDETSPYDDDEFIRLLERDSVARRVDATISGQRLTIFKATKNIVSEGWPFVLSRIFAMGENFVMVAILSNYDPEYLEVSPLIISSQLLVATSFVGVIYSTAIASGMRLGAGRINEIGRVLQSSQALSATLSTPVIGLCLAAKPILVLLGQDPHLAQIAQQYFYTFAAGAPGFLMYNACQQFYIGLGYPKSVLLSTIINTGLIGGLGYVLTYGPLGLPSLGIVGMGAAYSLSHYITLGGLLTNIFLNPTFHKYEIFKIPKIRDLLTDIIELLKLGIPIGVQVAAELSTVMAISTFAGWLGDSELDANAIAEQYLGIAIVVAFGFSQSVGTLVSREYGAKNYNNARLLGNIGITLGLGLSGSACALFGTLSRPMIHILQGQTKINESTQSTIQSIFLLNGIGLIGDYVRNIGMGALRGYYYTKIPMLISILTMCVTAISLGYVFGFPENAGLEGIYAGRTISMYLGGGLIAALWLFVSNWNVLQAYREEAIQASKYNSDNRLYNPTYFRPASLHEQTRVPSQSQPVDILDLDDDKYRDNPEDLKTPPFSYGQSL